MKHDDKVICIGEFCHMLTQGHIYTIENTYTDNTVTVKEFNKFRYSMQLFMDVNEYRRNTILKIKEKIKGS